MATFQSRQTVFALFVALVLAGIPSHAIERRSVPGEIPRAAQQVVKGNLASILRSLFGGFLGASGTPLRAKSIPAGAASQAAATGGATSDTGNTLDPNG